LSVSITKEKEKEKKCGRTVCTCYVALVVVTKRKRNDMRAHICARSALLIVGGDGE
jgi:hypothetical protein